MNKSKGRPKNPIKAAREKYTTMINPDLICLLKKRAADERITVADLLENLLTKTFIK